MLHQSETIDNDKIIKILIEQNKHLRQLANIAFFFLIIFLISLFLMVAVYTR